MSIDERIDKLEIMLRDILAAILDIPAASRRYGLEAPSPFSMGVEANKPPIPNGPDDVPPVHEAGIVKELVLYDIPGTGLRWYADLGESVAIVRPFTPQYAKAHFTDCGKPIPTGCYSYGTLRLPSAKWDVVKRVRNPLAAAPECCGE